MNNYYVTSQLVADRQAALATAVKHRAQVKDARAAHKASTFAGDRPARGRRPFFARPAHASA